MNRITARFKLNGQFQIEPITSPLGNFLPLRDPLGRLVEDAAHIVLGFMYFPDDLVTAWAYFEANRMMADDPRLGDYQGDEPYVSKWIKDSVKSTLRQRQNAQIIGSIFLAAAAEQRPVSYRKAVYLAQKILDRGGAWQDRRHPRDQTNLRAAFDRFKPSIHLLLAMTVLKVEEWRSISTDQATLVRFLSAAAQIQSILSSFSEISNWRPWAIHPAFVSPNDALDLTGFSADSRKLIDQYHAKPDRDDD